MWLKWGTPWSLSHPAASMNVYPAKRSPGSPSAASGSTSCEDGDSSPDIESQDMRSYVGAEKAAMSCFLHVEAAFDATEKAPAPWCATPPQLPMPVGFAVQPQRRTLTLSEASWAAPPPVKAPVGTQPDWCSEPARPYPPSVVPPTVDSPALVPSANADQEAIPRGEEAMRTKRTRPPKFIRDRARRRQLRSEQGDHAVKTAPVAKAPHAERQRDDHLVLTTTGNPQVPLPIEEALMRPRPR